MNSNNKISETAVAIASLRALSYYETEPVLQSRDSVAEIFLPEDKRTLLKDIESRETVKRQIPKGLYEYVIARTKYFDAVCLEAIINNTRQIVLVGAGYDSRPYRFQKFNTNSKIYELDAKPTQVHKLSCLRNHNIEIPNNISFIPADFETDNIIDALCGRGYDKEKQTLFLWEGVTFYLTKDTVTRMLHLLNNNSGRGSRVCFDFQTIHDDNDLIRTGLEDETIKFGIETGGIKRFIRELNYQIIEHITAEEMERRYLTRSNSELAGRIIPIMNFILIEH